MTSLAIFAIFLSFSNCSSRSEVTEQHEHTHHKHDHGAEERIPGPWEIQEYGATPININLPFSLQKVDAPTPKSLIPMLGEIESYRYETRHILCTINVVKYKAGIATDLIGIADGAIGDMQSQDGVRGFDYNEKQVSLPGGWGIQHKGTYRFHGKHYAFGNLMVSREDKMWQVTITYRDRYKHGNDVVEKAFASIKVNQ